jgi:carnitine 3-dehydrogenase
MSSNETSSIRPAPDAVRRVGLVGAGLIGAGWAAYFLAQGLEVFAFDLSPAAADRMDGLIRNVWPVMRRAGLVRVDGEPPSVRFGSLSEICTVADLVIESGPESLPVKRALMTEIDAVTRPDVVIASSSSSLLPSDYQRDAAQPGRILGAHPFNPPSLVPLVEIVSGDRTAPDAADWSMAFFKAIGKRPIRVRREQPGFIANRMTAALYREAVDLVASGVASVEDVDAAICYGPGLRWAVMGPHLLYHLGGGAGGYRHYLDHLGPSQEARWATLRSSPLSPEVRTALVDGVEEEMQALALTAPEALRDAALADILSALAALRTPR